MADNKNLLLAIVLSMVILFGFQAVQERFFPKPPVAPSSTVTSEQRSVEQATPQVNAPPTQQQLAPGSGAPTTAAPSGARARGELLAEVPRVPINTPRLHGSISLIGGRIDDITLATYHETLSPTSPEIALFSPLGSADAYFAESGWVPSAAGIEAPGANTRWTADGKELTPTTPLTLTWDNGQGLLFKRAIAVDDHYLFTITQTVESRRADPVTLVPYSLIARFGNPPISQYYVLFEGPLGVFNGTLSEIKYKDLQEKRTIPETTTGGWIGITDKYWMSALIPDQQDPVNARFVYDPGKGNNGQQYQVDFLGQPQVLAPGGTITAQSRLFAGAKVVTLIDQYEQQYQIKGFDRAIDWGWFYFLTRPMFYALYYLNQILGNFGLAILALTVIIKLAFYPLANKSYRSMSQMRKLQPEMLALRERFADDKARLNQEMMALYKREKINPAAGCLPILIQIPVFFSLYKVLFVTIEMRHAPFFGWIKDLSAPDPTTIFNLFGLVPWTPPQFLMIGAWPVIMGITMYLQQKLNPQPPDPIQAKVFAMLPFVFTFMLAQFPAGLVIYWTWNNILSIIQQWVIMRRMGVKP